jgi:hypothetical protein
MPGFLIAALMNRPGSVTENMTANLKLKAGTLPAAPVDLFHVQQVT